MIHLGVSEIWVFRMGSTSLEHPVYQQYNPVEASLCDKCLLKNDAIVFFGHFAYFNLEIIVNVIRLLLGQNGSSIIYLMDIKTKI